MQIKEFLIFLTTIILVCSTVYLLFSGKLNALGGIGFLFVSGVFLVMMWNHDVISSIVGSWGERAKFQIEMNRIRADVFAKADSVKHMGEQLAGFAANEIAMRARIVGDDHVEQMLVGRDKVKEFLVSLGSDERKINETVAVIDHWATFDLKLELQRKIRVKAVSRHTGGQLEKFMESLELQLDHYQSPSSRPSLISFLKEQNVYEPSLDGGLDRLDRFLADKRL